MTNARRAYWLCLTMQLRGLRESLLTFVLQSVGVPLVLLGGLHAAQLIVTPSQQALAVAGSSVLAMLGIAFLALPGALARMRERGQLGYFAALPLESLPFLLAQLTAYSLLALPAALLAPFAGAYIIGFSRVVAPAAYAHRAAEHRSNHRDRIWLSACLPRLNGLLSR